MFIIIDGIDGSGKSTALDVWKEYLTDAGNAIFDLKHYWQTNHAYPELSEIKSYDFILSCEPTYVGVGQVIREELIRRGTDYPVQAIAEAYSLDRLILYKKLLIPLLADGKCVINDRSFSTSLAYQTISGQLNYSDILKLPGNALALQYRPDHLVLMEIRPEKAIARLGGRLEKQDNTIFEKLDFLTKFNAKFNDPAYRQIFTAVGTQIHDLSAEPEIAIMKTGAVDLLKSMLVN